MAGVDTAGMFRVGISASSGDLLDFGFQRGDHSVNVTKQLVAQGGTCLTFLSNDSPVEYTLTALSGDRVFDVWVDDGTHFGAPDDFHFRIVRTGDIVPPAPSCTNLTYNDNVITVLGTIEGKLGQVQAAGNTSVGTIANLVAQARQDAQRGVLNLPQLVSDLLAEIEGRDVTASAKREPRTRAAVLEAECFIYGLAQLYGR